eukprot:12120220-Alexandrium_andersonii.AAC.1
MPECLRPECPKTRTSERPEAPNARMPECPNDKSATAPLSLPLYAQPSNVRLSLGWHARRARSAG